MKVIPIALYLKERADASEPALDEFAIPLPAPEPIDPSAEIEDAFQRGKQEGEDAARAAFAEELRQATAKHEAQLADERARWASEQGAVLAERLQEMAGEMERRLADAVSQALEPVLAEDARNSAIADFIAVLKGLREQQPASMLSISGPADLVDAIKAKLGEDFGARYSASDHAEARVEVGDTVIETQLGSWAKRLTEALT